MKQESYWRYWGKADPKYPGDPKWHPLVYHSLDVAACGAVLLERQPGWLESLCHLSGLAVEALRPWLVFMLAIHDLGKFANGFQQQRSDLQKELQGREDNVANGERHDTLGYVLGAKYLPDWLGQDTYDEDAFALFRPWLAAVTGHHGRPPKSDGPAPLIIRNHFPVPVVADAKQFVTDIAGLLLPDGIPLPSPDFGLEERYQRSSWLLAGLAVTADWLGSNTLWFCYREPVYSFAEYWHALAAPQARKAVEESGIGFGIRRAVYQYPNAVPAHSGGDAFANLGGNGLYRPGTANLRAGRTYRRWQDGGGPHPRYPVDGSRSEPRDLSSVTNDGDVRRHV